MEKQCNICKEVMHISNFAKNRDKVRPSCKKCNNEKQNLRRKLGISKRVPKNLTEEERKELARIRAKEWYKNNKDRARKRIKAYYSSDYGKQVRRDAIAKNKEKNPEYWRYKKKSDKVKRRCRELDAGYLSASALTLLEFYNTNHFNCSSFTCEYCGNMVGNDYHLDHILPISKNGTSDITNLAIACSKCNLQKGPKLLEEYKPELIDYFRNRKLC